MFVLTYCVLFWSGRRFFVVKTGVMPVFLLYGLALRRREAFVADWAPLLAATVLFDAIRGAIYDVTLAYHLPIHAQYPASLEKALKRLFPNRA